MSRLSKNSVLPTKTVRLDDLVHKVDVGEMLGDMFGLVQDETPLFLAAREGSYQACKALLEAYANREITDHMDRLPRDVASERLHHDIVRLLDEHVPRSPQMVNVIPNSSMMSKFCASI
jgi:hypothetical protein